MALATLLHVGSWFVLTRLRKSLFFFAYETVTLVMWFWTTVFLAIMAYTAHSLSGGSMKNQVSPNYVTGVAYPSQFANNVLTLDAEFRKGVRPANATLYTALALSAAEVILFAVTSVLYGKSLSKSLKASAANQTHV
ncbi:hypothetical protein FKW77_006246 [Venturia effusa]|uniref:MARVEL domain-containing protein n=1 Tax=Venturia effusa TaxID=50376 RepID=A0A517LQI0_9PEZI|nr:hypothetical protein FKW77_006246 [Venturia effusa]